MKANRDNRLKATVAGKRKREVVFVVPAKYTAMATQKEIAVVLKKELKKKKEKYKLFEMKIEAVNTFKRKAYFE